jgi:hypothetical protein
MAAADRYDSLAVLVLTGAEGDPETRAASVEAVLGEGVPPDRVFDIDETAGALAAHTDLLAFIRPGDRWVPGCLELHRAALCANPKAALSAGQYRRIDCAGDPIAEGGLTSESVDVSELAVRCPIEASATIVRGHAVADLDSGLDLLSQPGGDIALWCDCAAQGPMARVDAVVADVLWDPGRHGLEPAPRVAALHTLARSAVGRSGPAAASIRRELLARIFLEGANAPDGFDAATLAGDDGLRGVVADLQWVLEQQARQLAALWRGWPDTPPDEELSRLQWPEDAVVELTHKQHLVMTERARAEYQLQTLAARLRERDAYIARVTGPGFGTGA